jgi:glycosyltransferase involved in cell wall biosynthesis
MFGPSPLNIAVVAPLVAPLGEPEPYGNHAFLIDLARGLAARGHGVRLYAAEGSRVPGADVVPIAVDREARGAFIHADRPAKAPNAAMRRAFERLFARVRADGPDAVSQHAFDVEAIELAEDLPVLHTLHMPPLVPAVVDACQRTRATLAAVSRTARAQWQAAGCAHVCLLPNGVPDFDVPQNAVEAVAIVAGRICPEKGIAVAVRAGLAAGLAVHIVGGIYDEAYFTTQVEPLLGPRVRLEACVPRATLWRYLARAAVCLVPIDWDEPFGLVAAEAQVAGCPVVGYARGALPEIVEQDVSGILVEPRNEPALVAAIARARTLERRRVRESARARLLVEPALERYEATLGSLAS